MSEMTQVPENISKPLHKYIWFAIFAIIGYIAAFIVSYFIYTIDGYKVFIENNENFNLLVTIGWPLTSFWDLYTRFLEANESTNYIWLLWIVLMFFVYIFKNKIPLSAKKQYLAVSFLAIIITAVISYLEVSTFNLGVGATDMLGMIIVLGPVVVFLLITILGGEYFVLRRQVAAGTFLMDQYVPSFDYID